MARTPGALTEFGSAASEAWDAHLAATLSTVSPPERVVVPTDDRTVEVTTPDWQAYPVRAESCLTRHQAHRLLDWRTPRGDEGRVRHQEEYLEWRAVRGADGRLSRVEMTTEFADYWELLAAFEPARTIELVGEFAGAKVDAAEIYGDLDPFAGGVTPAARRSAFAESMRPPPETRDIARLSPHNSGQKAICCMIEPTNTLGALINLVAAAAEPHVVTDPVSRETRAMSGSEAIRVIRRGAAQDCRNSDTLVVERVVRLATEGRLLAFDDPIGVYILGVSHDQLVQPDGTPVPLDWFELGRGVTAAEATDGRARHQRLVFEVPHQEFCLADLRHGPTDQPIEHGAQIAELVQLGVYIRMSAEDVKDGPIEPEPLPMVTPCPEQSGCAAIRASWQQFEADSAR